MRSTLLFCALMTQMVGLCLAQSSDQMIPYSDRTVDFGTVARAAKTEHRFQIHNPYKTEMQISGIRASCGCTTPIIEDKIIKPGETGSILARFNTGTFTGQKGATLTVSITKPVFTELQLNVKGYIRSDVVLSPGEASFGAIDEGEKKSLELTLNYAGRSDWEITSVTAPFDYISASAEEVSRAGGRVQYKISVEISADAPAGFLENQLVLHTNDRRLTTVPLPLLATVESPIEISPKSVTLSRNSGLDPVEQRLVLKGKKPFRIIDITSESAEITFDKSEAEPKRAHLINIKIAPKANASGEFEGQLKIQTDMFDKPLKLDMNYDRQSEVSAAQSESVVSNAQTLK